MGLCYSEVKIDPKTAPQPQPVILIRCAVCKEFMNSGYYCGRCGQRMHPKCSASSTNSHESNVCLNCVRIETIPVPCHICKQLIIPRKASYCPRCRRPIHSDCGHHHYGGGGSNWSCPDCIASWEYYP